MKFLRLNKSKLATILSNLNPWTLWTVQPQANINGYWILLKIGDELLLNLILISTFVFSFGIHAFCFPNISAFIAFTPGLVSSNFKYIFEMPCEFPAIYITFPNYQLTSLSWKPIFTVNITLALILILRIPASPPVSLWFRFNTSLIFCTETFFGKLSIAFIWYIGWSIESIKLYYQHCLIVWVSIFIFCINMECIFRIVYIFRLYGSWLDHINVVQV